MVTKIEQILAGLTEPQLEAVTHLEGPLLVLAGAGSGKTRVITRRIAYMVANGLPPWNIVAVTFTNKAAGEMKNRTSALLADMPGRPGERVMVSTFHSLCVRILRQYGEAAGLTPGFGILDSADQTKLFKQVLAKVGLSVDNFNPGAVQGQISRAKNNLQNPVQVAAKAVSFFDKGIARAYVCYEEMLKAAGMVDFDDLLVKTALLLRDNAEARSQLQEKYGYILIDEYQDTNKAQFVIAHTLAMNHKNICATGDPDQSIYGWRGADIQNILEFEEFFPGAKVVRLEQNYRSTKVILKAASALIENNRGRKKKDLWTENESGEKITVLQARDQHHEAQEVVRMLQTAQRETGMTWDTMAIFYRTNALSRVLEDALMGAGVPYQIVRGTEFYGRKEVKDVLAYLKVIANPRDGVSFERIINVPPRGIGDSTVTKLSAFASEHALTGLEACARAREIPGISGKVADICRQLAWLFDSWRKYTSILEGPSGTAEDKSAPAADPLFDPALARLAQDELVGDDLEMEACQGSQPAPVRAAAQEDTAGRVDLQRPSAACSVPSMRICDLMEKVVHEAGFRQKRKNGLDDEEVTANVDELINVAAEFDLRNPGGSLQEYLEQVALVSDVDRLKEGSGAVTLMTLHAAKGLEFPLVVMIGLEDGLLPHQRALSGPDARRDLEEERRLAFVGITRAMRRLILTCVESRMVRGQIERQKPSMFLGELPPECLENRDLTFHAPPAGPSGVRETIPKLHAQVARPESSGNGRAMHGSGYRRGLLVRHARYGLGRVEEVLSTGPTQRVRVNFQSYGLKTMVTAMANLEPVDR
ncbi:MAG: UvrD-helicase domain-containing protein [Phycisphaerae bacterium]|nr:UvrD-helicase domain-containing protein [Phycisphaerae bacterium]